MSRGHIIFFTFCMLLLVFPTASPGQTGGKDAAALYKAKCATCHGPDGTGQTTMGKVMKTPDLRSAAVQKKTDAELTHSIKMGSGKMPAFGRTLDPDKIKELVEYVRGFGKK